MESSPQQTDPTNQQAAQEAGQQPSGGTDDQITPEQRKQLKAARRCFEEIERLSQVMSGYPPGHPRIEEAEESLYEGFQQYFELTGRLTVQVFPHWMNLYEVGERVWETEEPSDYCFVLNRDGIYLFHFLQDISQRELRGFVAVLNELVDTRNVGKDAVSLLFDQGFENIHWEAVDESLARLAGLEMQESGDDADQDQVEELFNDAFEDEQEVVTEEDDDEPMLEEDFDVRLEGKANKHMKLEVGSREFLELGEEAQQHLEELKRGFEEHRELEHRQGEVLSAVLGAKPRSKLRKEAVNQIGEVMGGLLESRQPWEALTFLKLIHQWRDKFQDKVAGELKEVVRECFTQERIKMLTKQIAESDADARRSILQMFDAVGLEKADEEVVALLGWNLDDETREDVVRYIHKQTGGDELGFIERVLPNLPGDKAEPLVEILERALPESKSMLLDLLERQVAPSLKARVLQALRGTWEDPTVIRDKLVPLVEAGDSDLRIEAARSLADAAPQHVYRVLEPQFTPELTDRPDEEVEELLKIFIEHGGRDAVDRLEDLVKRKKLANDPDIDLAVAIVNALIKKPTREVVELLESTASDWMVAGPIRSTCKEVVELVKQRR